LKEERTTKETRREERCVRTCKAKRLAARRKQAPNENNRGGSLQSASRLSRSSAAPTVCSHACCIDARVFVPHMHSSCFRSNERLRKLACRSCHCRAAIESAAADGPQTARWRQARLPSLFACAFVCSACRASSSFASCVPRNLVFFGRESPNQTVPVSDSESESAPVVVPGTGSLRRRRRGRRRDTQRTQRGQTGRAALRCGPCGESDSGKGRSPHWREETGHGAAGAGSAARARTVDTRQTRAWRAPHPAVRA
jgi:hypothetical protein